VHVYDVRSWKALGSWPRVMKYEIIALHFSQHDPTLAYVVGLDHEVYCGNWAAEQDERDSKFKSTLTRQGFRGDSRWIGLDRVGASDTLIGLTEGSHMYVLKEPQLMASQPGNKEALSRLLESTENKGAQSNHKDVIQRGTKRKLKLEGAELEAAKARSLQVNQATLVLEQQSKDKGQGAEGEQALSKKALKRQAKKEQKTKIKNEIRQQKQAQQAQTPASGAHQMHSGATRS